MLQLSYYMPISVLITSVLYGNEVNGEREKDTLLLPFMQEDYYIACNATLRALIDHVNNRSDILKDYQLVADAPEKMYDTWNEMTRHYDELEDGTFVAPVAVGQDGACEETAASLGGVQMIQISQSCSGAYVMSRRRTFFNNLYSTLGSTDNYKYAGLEAIQSIGKWKQVGIIFSLSLRDNVMMAFNLLNTLTSNRIEVKQFIGVPSMREMTTDDFAAISQTRIIALMPSGSYDCRDFLCGAYTMGIRPPLYLFVEWIPACLFSSLDVTFYLPEGCTQEMIDIQIAGTLFIGIPPIPFHLPSNSSLGISPSQLDQMIDEKLKEVSTGDMVDYTIRYACYDAFMSSILLLNEAEEILKSRYNLTLRDYKSPSTRNLVYKVVNSTAARMNYSGFRNPRIVRGLNGEINQDLYIMQPYQGKPRLIAHLTYDLYVASRGNSSGYIFHLDAEPIWATKSGHAPYDLSVIQQRRVKCGQTLVISVSIMAGLLSAAQFFEFLSSIRLPSEMFFSRWKKILVFTCCLLFNISAVFHIVGSDFATALECFLRPIIPTLSVTLIHGLLFAQLLVYSEFVRFQKPKKFNATYIISLFEIRNGKIKKISGSNSKKRTDKNRKSTRRKLLLKTSKTENCRQIRKSFVTVCLPCVIVLGAWLSLDPLAMQIEKAPVMFDDVADTYFEIEVVTCRSDTTSYWMGALLAYNALVIMLANCFSFNIRRRKFPIELLLSSKLMRLAALNAATILAAVVLLMVIVADSKIPCIVNAVLAFGELLYSATMAAIILLPVIIKRH